MKSSLIKSACIVIAIIFVFNMLAYQFYWYTAITWFDMLMHTLGGLFLGLASASLFSRQLVRRNTWQVAVIVLSWVIIIGFGWEVFEYVVQFLIKGVHLADIPDSISDMLCDIAGGIISCYFVLHAKKRYTIHNDNT